MLLAGSLCGEPQFLVENPWTRWASVRLFMFTSRALPKCPETFLSKDLPEAVDDPVVCRLACSRCHLESGLDDISRGHQRGRRYALRRHNKELSRCIYRPHHRSIAVWEGVAGVALCMNQCCNSHGRRGRKSHSCFLGEENVTCLCLDVHALQMFVTCYSSSSEQLQSPQPSVFIRKFFLAVGVNREVDGREWDVTQEAGFGSLKRG